MSNQFPPHKFEKHELNNLAFLMSSSMLIVPGALSGMVLGTIFFLPMSAVTTLTVLGGVVSFLSAYALIHHETPNVSNKDKKNEKEALIAIATAFSILIGAICGISFGEIFLFKIMPGLWPNLEAFLGLLGGMLISKLTLNLLIPSDKITANSCVTLSIAFHIMLYTGLFSVCLLKSFPGWLSFYGWGAGLGIGLLGGLGIGSLISKNMTETNEYMFAKMSLLSMTLPSIISGLVLGLMANIYFDIASIYFTLGVGFSITSAMLYLTYEVVKYFGDCSVQYKKEIAHNILILTSTLFPLTLAGSLTFAGVYSFFNVYTDGLYLAIAYGCGSGALLSFSNFTYQMTKTLFFTDFSKNVQPDNSKKLKEQVIVNNNSLVGDCLNKHAEESCNLQEQNLPINRQISGKVNNDARFFGTGLCSSLGVYFSAIRDKIQTCFLSKKSFKPV